MVMTNPIDQLGDVDEALNLVHEAAIRYIASLPDRPVRAPSAELIAPTLGGTLPENGDGTLEAVRALIDAGMDAAIGSAGGRFFHFVVGGATPAALAAEWLTAALDQNTGMWAASPFGAGMEVVAIDWLKQLFDLPASWGGVLVTGGTMANYVGLAAARRWWALQHDVDIDEDGWTGLPCLPVFASGLIHASSVKALGMLGIGRRRVTTLTCDSVGRLDVEALEGALESLQGAPAVIVATAGEPNAGDFDPVRKIVDLARAHNAWVHVDGAFGLFARLSPNTSELVAGLDEADSAASDGHKWLNVPHDCGFAFVRDEGLLRGAFGSSAAYYVGGGVDQPNFALMAPESSRKARAFAVWATLRAYGRSGYQAMVERHVGLARRVARRVDEADDLQRLADVQLNVVCFRYRPAGVPEEDLDALNQRLGEAVLADGRVYVGTTTYGGRVAFRPAIVNYRSTEADVDLLVDVIREVGASLVMAHRAPAPETRAAVAARSTRT
jgi:glutamate/tyrosine decarboxylase-like PLP-dependent enzyme